MALATNRRLNWQKWLYPGPTGLQTDQNWHRQRGNNHRANEHYPGVVSGLRVEEDSPAALTVVVKSGRAIDVNGDELVLSGDTDIDLSSYASGGGTAYIVAEYADTGADSYVVLETGAAQSRYYEDDPTISHQASAATGAQIELARVVVTNGAATITDPSDPNAPGNNEIDMRSRDVVGRPHRVVLFPGDGNLETQLAYVQRGYEYWLMPGAWTLGANLTIDVAGVKIRGSRLAVVSMGSYKITTSADDILIEGMTLRSSAASGTNPIVEIASARAVLRDVLIDKTGSYDRIYGVSLISGCSDVLIEGCDIEKVASDNAGATQIRCDGGSGGTGCRIVGCRITLDEAGANTEYGVKADAATDNPYLSIESCAFTIAASATTSKVAVSTAAGWKIVNCEFAGGSDGYQQGIDIPAGSVEVVVQGCSFDNMGGLITGGIVDVNAEDCLLAGNVFSGSSSASTLYCLHISQAGNTVVNNTFIISHTGATVLYGIYVTAFGTGDHTLINNNNLDLSAISGGACLGIYLNSIGNVSIVGNLIKCISVSTDYCYSVSIQLCTDITMTGNTLYPSAGNLVVGFYMGGSNNCAISGNTLVCGGGSGNEVGIYFNNDCDRVVVTGNSLYSGVTTDYSVYVDTGVTIAECHFICNVFNGAGTGTGDGMTISGTATFSTAGGTNNNRAHNVNSTANNN